MGGRVPVQWKLMCPRPSSSQFPDSCATRPLEEGLVLADNQSDSSCSSHHRHPFHMVRGVGPLAAETFAPHGCRASG